MNAANFTFQNEMFTILLCHNIKMDQMQMNR